MESAAFTDAAKDLASLRASAVSPPRASAVPRSSNEYDSRTAESNLQQATARVNSMSLSEVPLLRAKRTREGDDHSFRMDKMPEAPSNVPRAQATLTAEQYQQQRMAKDEAMAQMFQGTASGQSGVQRDDSFSAQFLPYLLSHNNSGTSGRSNSGSSLNFGTTQDLLLQEPMLSGIDKGLFNQASSASLSGLATAADWALGSSTSLTGGNMSSFPTGGQSSGVGRSQPQSGSLTGSNFNLFSGPPVTQSGSGGGSGSFMLGSGLGAGVGTPAFLTSQNSGTGSGMSFLNQGNYGSQGSGGLFAPVAGSMSFGSMNIPFGVSANSMPVGIPSAGYVGAPMSGFGSGTSVDVLIQNQIGPINERTQHQQQQGMGGSQMPQIGPGVSLFGSGFTFASAQQQQQQQQSQLRKSPVTAKPRKSSSLASSAQAELKAAKQKVSTVDDDDDLEKGAEKYISWSPDQEAALAHAVEELGTEDWDSVAARIPGPHRTGAQCMRHWENKLSPHIKRGQWSPEEDEALKQLVERAAARGLGLLDIPWEEIKPYIPGRTLKQVRERWRSNLDPSIIRGDWSQEEDDMIIQMRDVQGMGWAAIARALRGRTEHSVKTRHRSMQRAKKRPWTEKEDRTIVELVKAGSDWATIANELKNRTAASVQMRWGELCGVGTV